MLSRLKFFSLLSGLMWSCLALADTAAYWRFETGPANTDVPHTTAAGVFEAVIPDVSGNGNSLSAWTQGDWAGYGYRADVPFSSIPLNGETNRFSVRNTGAYPVLFTSAAGSVPGGINLETITPAQFTIEASYKPENSGGYRTVVSRDARFVSSSDSALAALYLQVRFDDSVRILFTDVSGVTHAATSIPGLIYGFNASSNPEATNASWYHFAAVSDGSKLKLFVNNTLVATTDMTSSGSTNRALARGTTSGSDWRVGGWAVGRGLYAGGHTDRAYGLIDEVRISTRALEPHEFLAMPHGRVTVAPDSNGNLVLSASGGLPGATCYVLQSTDLSAPLRQWTSASIRGFDSNGNFSFVHPWNSSAERIFFVLRTTTLTPQAGPLRYQLAGGSQNWPADIRAQIVFAMDGAVALYNRYGVFNKQLTANYNPGVPTAQASFSGWIDFGGSRNYRTALHEIAHTLGVGTTSAWSSRVQNGIWTGAHGIAQVRQFDGPTANINSDGTHFWPYGLNYDNEASTENNRRHVLMVAAFRRDMGIE